MKRITVETGQYVQIVGDVVANNICRLQLNIPVN